MSSFSSKKFSAAEKHFQKILDTERKRNKKLAEDLAAASERVESLEEKVESLEKRNNVLAAELEVASEAAKLSPDDRKALVEKAYRLKEASKLAAHLLQQTWF